MLGFCACLSQSLQHTHEILWESYPPISNPLCNEQRSLAIPADLTLLLIRSTKHIHDAPDEGVETCQRGRIALLPSKDVLSDILDLRLVEETELVVCDEKFGGYIQPGPREDPIHIERLVASARLDVKDLILADSSSPRLRLESSTLRDLRTANGHDSERLVER